MVDMKMGGEGERREKIRETVRARKKKEASSKFSPSWDLISSWREERRFNLSSPLFITSAPGIGQR